MKFSKLLIYFVIIVLCQSNEEIIDFRDKAVVISPVQSIEKLSDSIYFSDKVGQIVSNHNMVLIPETNFAKYYFIDSNFDFLFEFGNSGKGPGEFIANYRGFFKDSMVYLPDVANGKIETYIIKKKLILDNQAVNNFHIGEYGAVINNDHHILTSSYLTSRPFLEYNPENGKVIDSFGSFIKYKNFNEKRANNCYLMAINEDNESLFTINIQVPYLRIFNGSSMSHELINEYEFKNEFGRYYKYLTEYFGGSFGKNGVMISFVEGIALNKQRLYLLVWDELFNIRNPNILIEIDYLNNFRISRVFKLSNNFEHSSFSSICFINNKLICFERYTSSLLVYDIY